VVVPDITNPYFASLVRAVERSAREAELQVFLVDTGEDPEEEVRAARTLASDVDGFVVLSPRQLHRQLAVFGSKPVVFVNRSVAGHGSVLIRTAPAMVEALHHLAKLGHRSVAYLTGPQGSWSASERLSSVRRTCRASGIGLLEIAVDSPIFAAAVTTVESILGSEATAVLAFNDQMALGVIAGLNGLGIAVPEQISVVGCDDVPMAAMVAPALTTIGMPTDEAGAAAIAMLLGEPIQLELMGTFVLRQSTGPVMPRRATVV
jgi:LacI family transcriptional regulator